MKIGFVVNEVATELTDYTSTHLALAAHRRGHEAWYIGIADFAYDPDERVRALARTVPRARYRSAETFLRDLKSDHAVVRRVTVDAFDILLLRYDPSVEATGRPWARLAGVNFGRLALRHGVTVLNDPDGLSHAINKMYLELFPKAVRPRVLISRSKSDIRHFAKEQGNTIVLKPLSGSGGRNVFLVRPEEAENLNQMIEAVLRDGYVIAQEYLPAAAAGDTRLFVMNGRMLERDGKVAAIHRIRPRGDMRSNLTAGGKARPAKITGRMIELVELIRPRLVEDGMFFVGLDIASDKLMEVNVFSPGGLVGAARLTGADFMATVIENLERKVQRARDGNHTLTNAEIATL